MSDATPVSRADDLLAVIDHLSLFLLTEISVEADWVRYHLLRATQGLVDQQELVDRIHDQVNRVLEGNLCEFE